MDAFDTLCSPIYRQVRVWQGLGAAGAIVGLYGTAKTVFAHRLNTKLSEEGRKTLFLSFKGDVRVSQEDVFREFEAALSAGGRASPVKITSFHSFKSALLSFSVRGETGITIIIEEAELLLSLAPDFFDVLEEFRYRLFPRVSVLFIGEPQLRYPNNSGYTRLCGKRITYMPKLTESAMSALLIREEQRLHIHLQNRRDAIFRLSGGHYGTMKYINQFIASNPSLENLTAKQFCTFARQQPIFPSFFDRVVASLTSEERLFLIRFLTDGVVPSDSVGKYIFARLIKISVLVTHGKNIRFCIPIFGTDALAACRRYGSFQSEIQILDGRIFILGNLANTILTRTEERVLEVLLHVSGEAVSYETLGTVLWPSGKEYSLWGIAKVMERIREKFSSLHIYSLQIINIRGVGYRLAHIS